MKSAVQNRAFTEPALGMGCGGTDITCCHSVRLAREPTHINRAPRPASMQGEAQQGNTLRVTTEEREKLAITNQLRTARMRKKEKGQIQEEANKI